MSDLIQRSKEWLLRHDEGRMSEQTTLAYQHIRDLITRIAELEATLSSRG